MELSEQNLAALFALVRKAGDGIMQVYDSNSTVVEWKQDHTPLTQADKASHEILVNGLRKLFPAIPVISEEGSENENKELLSNARYWLIDPIDGTQEFVNRSGEFCIAVGLIDDSKPKFGIVFAPILNIMYYGGPGLGSYKIMATGKREPISVQPLNPHIIAVSRSHPSPETTEYITDHYPAAVQKPLGSMLKQMKLAEGEVDIYPTIKQPLHLWDAAAGAAIIEGAGGFMTKLDGSPLDFSNTTLFIGDFVARATANL